MYVEVAIQACTAAPCPIKVRLIEGRRPSDFVTLNWASAGGAPQQEEIDGLWGAADPLLPRGKLHAWTTGEEVDAVSTLARAVALAPDRNGLLVDQLAGFDHLKRRHDLFISRGGRMTLARRWEEGAGPTWSAVATVPRRGRREDLLFFDGFRAPSSDEPDRLDVTAYLWDERADRLVERLRAPVTLYVLVLGVYPSVAAARRIRDAGGECLLGFWVLKTDPFPALPPGKLLLGALSTQRAYAEEAAQAVAACAPELKSSLVERTLS